MSATLARLVRRVRGQMALAETTSDSSLLARWVDRADQPAFELLVWRHGPMVWDTCRRVARHEQDAEDAFQATFLALARKADTIRHAPSLAGWLHRVASRAALSAAHRSRPDPRDDLDEVALARPDHPELRLCLDEEIARLPEVYREPFLMCCLQGMTTDEVAAALGCPRGTVGTRLAWARQRLRERLARRGVEMPALLPVGAGVPSVLVDSVLYTITAGVSGEAVAPGVAKLCQEMITMLWMDKIKSVALWLVPFVLVGIGLGGLSLTSARAEKPAKPDKKPAVKAADAKPGVKKPVDPPDVQGVVKSVSKDGKSVSVLVGRKNKNEDEKTVEIKFADKADVVFSGVGVDEAKIKEGYAISAWLEPKSKDTVARAILFGDRNLKETKPALAGPIGTVADDGKSFTVVLRKTKDGETVEKTVKLTDKTAKVFRMIGISEAKLAKDMLAMVWLAKGSEETAERVVIQGKGEVPTKKDGESPTHRGVVSGVAKDGKSFTLTEPPTKKNEDGAKVELKLNDKSRLVFTNVSSTEAKLKVGQAVVVWVEDSAKDTAKIALFQPAPPSKLGVMGGKVTAVGKDGKSFTMQLPSKKDSEGAVVEVKLGDKAQVSFDNVPAGGAKISEGYLAKVTLADGSLRLGGDKPNATLTATIVVFSPAKK